MMTEIKGLIDKLCSLERRGHCIIIRHNCSAAHVAFGDVCEQFIKILDLPTFKLSSYEKLTGNTTRANVMST